MYIDNNYYICSQKLTYLIMANNKISRTIPCNHRVKEYNVSNLQRIAAMTIGEVYDSISQSGGIISRKCATCKDLLDTLIKQVPMFMPSEPMSADDQKKTAEFIQRWLAHLKKKLAEVSKPVEPVYLRDTVTQILQRQEHDIKCENAMISWYLGQYKTRDLDPEKIAQAIVEHKGTEWAKIKPLVKDAEYNIRLTVPGADAGPEHEDGQEGSGHTDGAQAKPVTGKRSYMKGRHQEILAVFEYIESFPSTPGIERLDEQLRHDLAIVKEVINWRQQATDDYSYREQFQFYLEQLQTLPDNMEEITFATLNDKIRKRLAKAQPSAKKVRPKQNKKDEATPSNGGNTSKPTPTGKPSPTPPEKRNEEKYPGEEPDSLTPAARLQGEQTIKTDVPGSGSEQATTPHQKLDEFLKKKATNVPYLASNIAENNNASYIWQFSNRPDFDEVFEILVKNSNRPDFEPKVTANEIMGFIRNVVLRNERTWPWPKRVVQ